jgi:hypothetical protein
MIYAKEPEALARVLLGNETYNTIATKVGISGGKGHDFYEQWRSLPIGPEKSALEKISTDYYDSIKKAIKYGKN